MALVTGDRAVARWNLGQRHLFRKTRAVTAWDVDGTSAAVTGGAAECGYGTCEPG